MLVLKKEVVMKIDWKLYTDDKLIIDNSNVIIHMNGDLYEYDDGNGLNIIDKDKRVYERKFDDNIFRVDFNNCVCSLVSGELESSFDIECSYLDEGNKIRLIYYLDGKSEIVIDFKEEI